MFLLFCSMLVNLFSENIILLKTPITHIRNHIKTIYKPGKQSSEIENKKREKPVESRKRCVVPSSWNLQWRASSWCPAFAFINYNQQYLLGAPPLLLKPTCMLKVSLSIAYKKRGGIRNCKVPKKGTLLSSLSFNLYG